MTQLEKDKDELDKLRQELDWKQNEVDRLERAVEFGRCTRCDEPLSYGDKTTYCSDFPNCEEVFRAVENEFRIYTKAEYKDMIYGSGVKVIAENSTHYRGWWGNYSVEVPKEMCERANP